MTTSTDLIVNKTDLSEAKLVETSLPDPGPGQALLKVDEFALTANNITYGVTGKSFGYWDFFPAEEGYGRIPVWGFADVVASRADGVAEGERVYGYLPMSTHLMVEPGKVAGHGFMDVVAHRAPRAPIYNQYARTATDPGYRADMEALISLFRPLFTTSFLLDDYLAENGFFGAEAVILSSASSKTSLGLAQVLSQRGGVEVIGLTGSGNVGFVEGLGFYDRVAAYDSIADLPVAAAAFVDMAGSAPVREAIHTHYGVSLKVSTMVGATHWSDRGMGDALPGPKPEIFFAPGYAQERVKAWGMDGFQTRVGAAWVSFIGGAAGWLDVRADRGPEAVKTAYLAMLANEVSPREGLILSMWD
ncbi:MAG: DUF2855 family protein [Pseudomonadota bacterium]